MGTDKSTTRGVELRTGIKSESIRIKFMYKGMECRETLKLDHTKQNIRYAERLRGEILNAIELGKFDYAKYFPDSGQLTKLGLTTVTSASTVGELVREYLDQAKPVLAPSTHLRYTATYKTHISRFDNMLLTELTPPVLRAWIASINRKARTIRSILIPLRSALDYAVNDDLIEGNPLDRVKISRIIPKEAKRVEYVVDPFSTEEIKAILAACDGQERNVILFAFSTGMRPSEYLALRWGSVDWTNLTVLVERTSVLGITREETKTQSGRRSIDLRNGALQALRAQRNFTALEDNLVFQNPKFGAGWQDARELGRRWYTILKKAGVRRRVLYQTRHTFASTLLSSGLNALYVAKQMGHKDTVMVSKTYGKWIELENGALSDYFVRAIPGGNVAIKG
ncbi:Arm DNA-binding domain-containing protein [Duganella aquatilis]|nr:DUF3596 domain-containing protein [Duganella aquatilis]